MAGYPSAAPASAGTTRWPKSFFAALNNELIGTQPWPSRSAAHTAIFEWIESWYNLDRLHSSLDFRSPAGLRGRTYHVLGVGVVHGRR